MATCALYTYFGKYVKEKWCAKLAIVKFWGVLIFKRDKFRLLQKFNDVIEIDILRISAQKWVS